MNKEINPIELNRAILIATRDELMRNDLEFVDKKTVDEFNTILNEILKNLNYEEFEKMKIKDEELESNVVDGPIGYYGIPTGLADTTTLTVSVPDDWFNRKFYRKSKLIKKIEILLMLLKVDKEKINK